MPEPRTTHEGQSAHELVIELLPYLETVANLHYLLDKHVVNPERLKELRSKEDEAFEAMLKRVIENI